MILTLTVIVLGAIAIISALLLYVVSKYKRILVLVQWQRYYLKPIAAVAGIPGVAASHRHVQEQNRSMVSFVP